MILLRPGWHLKTRNLRIVWVATTNLTSKKDEKEATPTHTQTPISILVAWRIFFSSDGCGIRYRNVVQIEGRQGRSRSGRSRRQRHLLRNLMRRLERQMISDYTGIVFIASSFLILSYISKYCIFDISCHDMT